MLSIERESFILKLLKEREIIKLNELTTLLNISEATARRDLTSLEKQGLIKRVHGGAILIINDGETKDLAIQYRKNLNWNEKEKIAKSASNFLKPNTTIFLDAGTSTLALIKYLENKNIKVVTNGLNLIDELSKYSVESYLIGGKIKSSTSCVLGFSGVEYLKQFNFDMAFIGANAFDLEGYSTPDQDEAMIKKEVIERSKKVYFLCDNSKIDKKSFIYFSSLFKGCLITDRELPYRYHKINMEVAK